MKLRIVLKSGKIIYSFAVVYDFENDGIFILKDRFSLEIGRIAIKDIAEITPTDDYEGISEVEVC